MKPKRISQVLDSMPTSDGAGVKLNRAIGQPLLRNLDPFLMLDEIRSDDPDDYIAGFPAHPHKGFETLSYMLHGSMAHKDSTGGEGLITSGGVQYMTAGKGIIHSETPKQESGLLWGFQLWINLAARDKLQAAKYADIPQEQIPVVVLSEHTSVKLIAGSLGGIDIRGPVIRDDIHLLIADIRVISPELQIFDIDAASHGFVYVYKGALEINGKRVLGQQLASFHEGEELKIKASSDTGYLLLAGRPINEPIVQYGPFVMNSQQEIQQAISDYQAGKLA